ncbi:hypothetical protein DFH08DRAFT_821499 [Mycena albidolilacea]|uniref:Uncharacterized protein n=1 Tax=Mycena albidolilacea TaxID=1033008 RepID=A0AAD6ZAM6_9AGAR|nr:hypothetical protein DFH08DRAFT_821499 [Mycena albidolilacea]
MARICAIRVLRQRRIATTGIMLGKVGLALSCGRGRHVWDVDVTEANGALLVRLVKGRFSASTYPDGTIATSSPLGLDRRLASPDIGSSDSSEGLATPPEMWIFPHSVRIIPPELSVSTASSAEFSIPVRFFIPPGDVELPDIQPFSPFSFTTETLLPHSLLTFRHITPPHPHFQVDSLIQDPQNEAEELSNVRKLFLTHRFQLGLSVPDSTLVAISQGTSDHSALHSALLHASQLMGTAHLKNNVSNEPEAEQIHLTLGALQDPGSRVPRGPVASLQAVALLSLCFFHKGNIARTQALLLTGNTLVHEHSLDTMSSLSGPATPVESGRVGFLMSPMIQAETQAVVAQLMYLDASYAIILKLPSLVVPLLRTSFKRLITRPAKEEINFVHAKSV